MTTQPTVPREAHNTHKEVSRLMAEATAGKIRPNTWAKLQAFAEVTSMPTTRALALEADEADEISLALKKDFWDRLWMLLSPSDDQLVVPTSTPPRPQLPSAAISPPQPVEL